MHALRYTYIDLSISTGYSTTEINLTELLSKFLHILFKQIPFIYLKMMYFKVNSSMIPRDVEGTRIKRKEKSKKANGSSDFSNRLPNERKNHSDAWRFSYTEHLYIYIYIPAQRKIYFHRRYVSHQRQTVWNSKGRSSIQRSKNGIRFLKNVASCASFYTSTVYCREKPSRRSSIFPGKDSNPLLRTHLTNIHRYL